VSDDNRRPAATGTAEDLEGESLSTTIRDLRRRLRTAGPLARGDDLASLEWRLLREGANERGRAYRFNPTSWVNAKGGSEHVCRYLPAWQRWEKLTHKNSAGWWVDMEDWYCLPATPLQYLKRLSLSNEVLGDDVRFVGVDIGPTPYTTRIRTTQRHIVGESPSMDHVRAWLETFGFELQSNIKIGAYDALCCFRHDVWLFDVRPMNFVQCSDGSLIPIDLIVQRYAHSEELWVP
jgi:hypothetical protein